MAVTCDYGGEVVAGVEQGNVWAMQFHPEKSGDVGLRVVSNFVAIVKDSLSRGRGF